MAKAVQPLDFADIDGDGIRDRIIAAGLPHQSIRATPYGWPDAAAIPTRQWLFGHWLLKGEVTVLIAPGGTGKSTLAVAVALSMVSGKPLLGQSLPKGPQAVWLYNLEDSIDELHRQFAAACTHHGISAPDCAHRLFVDSGLDQPICTATEDSDGFKLNEDVFAQIETSIRQHSISVIIVDPFVSSHRARESSNEAMDAIVKRWKSLSHRTGCAVILIHHTRKLSGRDVTAEDGRGAVALRDAARVVLTLNPMSTTEAQSLGINDDAGRRSLIRIDTGKANRSPHGGPTWIKLEGRCLGNGDGSEPTDTVGVACLWQKPDVFDGLTAEHLFKVQQQVAEGGWRESVQARDWVGNAIADVTGWSATDDKERIKAVLRGWLASGALKIERVQDEKGKVRPLVIVGRPVDPSEIGGHHR